MILASYLNMYIILTTNTEVHAYVEFAHAIACMAKCTYTFCPHLLAILKQSFVGRMSIFSYNLQNCSPCKFFTHMQKSSTYQIK